MLRAVATFACVVLMMSGCGRAVEGRPDTGARQRVQSFCQALVERDWPKAYACLTPRSQRLCSQQEFGELAQNYLRGVGFNPEAVGIRLCEERGARATGHVVLTGRANAQNRRHRDAFLLDRTDDAWGIVLPNSW